MQLAYSIILPAWNESSNILRALKATTKVFDGFGKPYEIIVIDDGSIDDTTKKVEDYARGRNTVRLVRHQHNHGKGAAVKTGMGEARGEIRLFLDCDLSTQPQTFSRMLPLFKNHDIVIGSRRVPGAEIAVPQGWLRNSFGRLFNLLVRLRTGLPYHDTQCGFKAFHARTAPMFKQLKTTGWTFDVELLLTAQKKNYRVAEIPVEWRNGRTSHLHLMDAWNIWLELGRLTR